MRQDDARKLDHRTLEEMRVRAVRSVQNGQSPEVVAQALGINRTTIYDWLAQYRRGGRAHSRRNRCRATAKAEWPRHQGVSCLTAHPQLAVPAVPGFADSPIHWRTMDRERGSWFA